LLLIDPLGCCTQLPRGGIALPCPCLSTNDELYAGWANSNMLYLVATT